MSGEHGPLRLKRKVAIRSNPQLTRLSATASSPLSPKPFALSTPDTDAVAQPDDYPPVRNGFVTTTPP